MGEPGVTRDVRVYRFCKQPLEVGENVRNEPVLWTSNPATVAEFSIEQAVATAGDGVLKDNSACSVEFREYLAQIPSPKIATYIEHCLAAQRVEWSYRTW